MVTVINSDLDYVSLHYTCTYMMYRMWCTQSKTLLTIILHHTSKYLQFLRQFVLIPPTFSQVPLNNNHTVY
jgi:hypothetical protein